MVGSGSCNEPLHLKAEVLWTELVFGLDRFRKTIQAEVHQKCEQTCIIIYLSKLGHR